MLKRRFLMIITPLLLMARSCQSMDPATFCLLGSMGVFGAHCIHAMQEEEREEARARQLQTQETAPAQQAMRDQQEEVPLLNTATTQATPHSDKQVTQPPLSLTSLAHPHDKNA